MERHFLAHLPTVCTPSFQFNLLFAVVSQSELRELKQHPPGMAQVCMLLACFMIAVTSSVYANKAAPAYGRKQLSDKLYTFLTLLSGSYDNGQQVAKMKNTSDKHEFIQNVIKTVFVQSLKDKIAVLNHYINGTTIRNNLWILNEGNKGIFHLQFVNITSLGSHRPTDKNDVDYSDVTLAPQPASGYCESLVDQLNDNVYVAGITVCLDGTNLEVASYIMTLTSSYITSKQGFSLRPARKVILPYILFKRSSFPLLDGMVKRKPKEKDSR